MRLRVLVADDSALMRKYMREIIEEDPELEVVGTARDGEKIVSSSFLNCGIPQIKMTRLRISQGAAVWKRARLLRFFSFISAGPKLSGE